VDALGRKVYLFTDESGNFDFRSPTEHPGGPTRYFSVGTMMMTDETAVELLRADVARLREDLTREGHDLLPEGFHATEDKQVVRDAMYAVIAKHPVRFDSTLLEKAKAQPQTRVDNATFYQYAWYYHFKMLAQYELRAGDELMIVAASLGTKKFQSAFRLAVKNVVTQCCPWHITRHVAFWDMASDSCLQVADYGLWAVSRHWERGDNRALLQIPGKVATQYDLWDRGKTYYY
jgi:hypothetical protein